LQTGSEWLQELGIRESFGLQDGTEWKNLPKRIDFLRILDTFMKLPKEEHVSLLEVRGQMPRESLVFIL
jgi:hypothetical protein